MNKRTRFASLFALTAVLSCSDGTGPALDQMAQPELVADGGLHHLKWAPDVPVQFTAEGNTQVQELPFSDNSGLQAAEGSAQLALDAYKVGFWAVRGEHRYVQINYQTAAANTFSLSADAEIESPFLRLDVDEPVTRPDGSEIAVGDSVFITVYVDPADLVVYLLPHGLQFGSTDLNTLQMWYDGAGPDLNTDGLVNTADAYIEQQLLGLWYQATPGAPWTVLPSEQSHSEDWFWTRLHHFSGYAVSWDDPPGDE
jgi:hypothetical protein